VIVIKFKAKKKRKVRQGKGKRGNMAGLAKHFSHKYSEPGFFTKVMSDPLLDGYPDDFKKRIAARAHKLIVGIWPGEHRGKNPNGKG
jgi:hypothetical protein